MQEKKELLIKGNKQNVYFAVVFLHLIKAIASAFTA